jgi:hypothetical protein
MQANRRQEVLAVVDGESGTEYTRKLASRRISKGQDFWPAATAQEVPRADVECYG